MENLIPISGGAIVLGSAGLGYGVHQGLSVSRTLQGSTLYAKEVLGEGIQRLDSITRETLGQLESGLSETRVSTSALAAHFTEPIGGPTKIRGFLDDSRVYGRQAHAALDLQVDRTVVLVHEATDASRATLQGVGESMRSLTHGTATAIKRPVIAGVVAAAAGLMLLGVGISTGIVAATNNS